MLWRVRFIIRVCNHGHENKFVANQNWDVSYLSRLHLGSVVHMPLNLNDDHDEWWQGWMMKMMNDDNDKWWQWWIMAMMNVDNHVDDHDDNDEWWLWWLKLMMNDDEWWWWWTMIMMNDDDDEWW